MDLIEKTKNIRRHPWELSRSYNILKYFKKNNLVYADIGAGDKFFTSKLAMLTNSDVFAVDSEYEYKKEKSEGIISLNHISQLDDNSIDCIIMMDVLEHVENDISFLRDVLGKLKTNGKLIITVPAMQFLFSSHDIFLKHYRRYSRIQLINLLKRHDVFIEQCYYFYNTLLIIRCLSLIIEKIKLIKRNTNVGIGSWKYEDNNFITRILFFMLNIDFSLNKLLNKIHLRLPGLSLLAVCKKKQCISL